MRIELRRSNFSQFSDDLWLTATDGNTPVHFEIEQENLLEYANHLLDIAHDCLRKSSVDTEKLEDNILVLMDKISDKDNEKK
jgi:hypothetical protein